MRSSARATWALPIVLALSLGSSTALAEPLPSQADALFAEGRDLLERGRYAEACLKLAKSEELAPAVGTLLNLGFCFEQGGKLRSAMDAYRQAEALAGGAGETKRAQFAKERFTAVDARAMRIVVRVAPPAAPGLEIKRNGVVIPRTDLDRPIAVDPEDYLVTASAPGFAPWKGAIIVKGEGGVVTMIVPPLAETSHLATTRRTDTLAPRRWAALGLGALGVVAIGTGVGLAVAAKSRYEDAGAHCDDVSCDDTGNRIQRAAVAQGNVATALIGLGLLSGGAGAFLWFVAEPAPRAAVGLAVRPGGVGLEGLF